MTIRMQLMKLKKKTDWSWERMCREMHRVMGEEGPSHTTLFRYATGNVKRHNKVVGRWIKEGADRLTREVTR